MRRKLAGLLLVAAAAQATPARAANCAVSVCQSKTASTSGKWNFAGFSIE